MKTKGSCVCGQVQFSILGEPSLMGTCHCSRCRKLGTSTLVFVRREQFKIHSGQNMIETVLPQKPYTFTRSFCKACGTSLGEPLSEADTFPINAHCLDSDPGIRNAFHEFSADLPAWAIGLESEAALNSNGGVTA